MLMNIAITPTAEALIQQLIDLNPTTPEALIEEALQNLYSQKLIDTSLGFPELSESEIIQENEKRWQAFQKNSNGISQADAEARFLRSHSSATVRGT